MPHQRRPVAATLVFATATFLALSALSFHADDLSALSPSLHNWCGPVGAQLAGIIIRLFGLAAFFLVMLLFGAGLGLALGLQDWARRACGSALALVSLACLLALPPLSGLAPTLIERWQHWDLAGLGGDLGWYLAGNPAQGGGILVQCFSRLGSGIVALALFACGMHLLQLGLWPLTCRFYGAVRRRYQEHSEAVAAARRLPPRAVRDTSAASTSPAPLPLNPENPPSARLATVPPDEVSRLGARLAERETTASGEDASKLVERIRAERARLARYSSTDDGSPSAEPALPPPPLGSPTLPHVTLPTVAPASNAPAPNPTTHFQPLPRDTTDASDALDASDEDAGEADDNGDDQQEPATELSQRALKNASLPSQRSQRGYRLPGATILDQAPNNRDDESAAETERTAGFIEKIFSDYKINVKVVAATRGPYITQYELELQDAGMRVNKVAGLEQEMMLNLGTEGIRIVAPLPNKKTIGIEVPNQIKTAVVMRDLVEQVDPEKYALPLILGRDVLGNPMVGDLAKMPHLLVAGATGMGKSVCLNAIICSLLLFRDPSTCKFIMVDPKMVELAPYEGIPHLLSAPITDMTKAHAALEWACKVMDQRYFALRLAGVREIRSYNELGAEELNRRLEAKGKTLADLDGVEAQMPYIVVVVDEYADLMMVNKEVEKSIVRLTAKSRACGIHIILTTQRPSADVVTGLIKSNLPSRICFRVADRNNSRVVLDASGAENLLGRGDMLYLPPGASTLVRGQGVWVKDHEIDAIIQHSQAQGTPNYDDSIFQIGAAAIAGGGESGSSDASAWLADRKFHEAVQAVFRHNRTGADFLRRRLAIGYNKATQYVEWLEDLGFLSPSKGTQPRELQKSWQDWIDLLKENGLSWEEDDELYHDPFA